MGFWNNFWDVVWFGFWIFAFTAYLFALFSIIADLFRDKELNGWWKAVWIIFLVFVPFLTALVYVIARGRGMSERSARRAHERAPEYTDEYVRSVSFSSPADEIAKAKALMDQGTLTQGEYEAIKNKALGNKF
jgi:hypothetical protein